MTNETETIDQPPRARTRWQTIAILFSAFGIIVFGLFFFFANVKYINLLKLNTQTNLAKVDDALSQVQQEMNQLSETVRSQDQIINSLRQMQSGYNRDQWRIMEAEFLVKLANDKLTLDHNGSQAILLLKRADTEIQNINDARLLSVRQALAADIASLQAVPTVDVPGIYLRLLALGQQINQLSLPNKPAFTNKTPIVTQENLPWWKRGLDQTWQTLRQLVIVRYNPKGAMPLMMPEEQGFLYQNLQASLQKAMWGLLHHEQNIYQQSLLETSQWIKQYFVMDSPLTQSVLTNLNQLAEINVNPVMPSQLDSLKAFTEYFATSPN